MIPSTLTTSSNKTVDIHELLAFLRIELKKESHGAELNTKLAEWKLKITSAEQRRNDLERAFRQIHWQWDIKIPKMTVPDEEALTRSIITFEDSQYGFTHRIIKFLQGISDEWDSARSCVDALSLERQARYKALSEILPKKDWKSDTVAKSFIDEEIGDILDIVERVTMREHEKFVDASLRFFNLPSIKDFDLKNQEISMRLKGEALNKMEVFLLLDTIQSEQLCRQEAIESILKARNVKFPPLLSRSDYVLYGDGDPQDFVEKILAKDREETLKKAIRSAGIRMQKVRSYSDWDATDWTGEDPRFALFLSGKSDWNDADVLVNIINDEIQTRRTAVKASILRYIEAFPNHYRDDDDNFGHELANYIMCGKGDCDALTMKFVTAFRRRLLSEKLRSAHFYSYGHHVIEKLLLDKNCVSFIEGNGPLSMADELITTLAREKEVRLQLWHNAAVAAGWVSRTNEVSYPGPGYNFVTFGEGTAEWAVAVMVANERLRELEITCGTYHLPSTSFRGPITKEAMQTELKKITQFLRKSLFPHLLGIADLIGSYLDAPFPPLDDHLRLLRLHPNVADFLLGNKAVAGWTTAEECVAALGKEQLMMTKVTLDPQDPYLKHGDPYGRLYDSPESPVSPIAETAAAVLGRTRLEQHRGATISSFLTKKFPPIGIVLLDDVQTQIGREISSMMDNIIGTVFARHGLVKGLQELDPRIRSLRTITDTIQLQATALQLGIDLQRERDERSEHLVRMFASRGIDDASIGIEFDQENDFFFRRCSTIAGKGSSPSAKPSLPFKLSQYTIQIAKARFEFVELGKGSPSEIVDLVEREMWGQELVQRLTQIRFPFEAAEDVEKWVARSEVCKQFLERKGGEGDIPAVAVGDFIDSLQGMHAINPTADIWTIVGSSHMVVSKSKFKSKFSHSTNAEFVMPSTLTHADANDYDDDYDNDYGDDYSDDHLLMGGGTSGGGIVMGGDY